MARIWPLSTNTRKATFLKSLFLFMLVWFMGLFMGSYLQSSNWAGTRQFAIPVPFRHSHAGTEPTTRLGPQSTLGISANASQSCSFPVLDPLDPKILRYIRKMPPLDCAKFVPSVVDVVGDQLVVNSAKLKAKLKRTSVEYCKYRSLKMHPGNDYKVDYGPWSQKFNKIISLNTTDENVHVECYQSGMMVSKQFLAIVRKKPETEKKRLDDYHKHVQNDSPKETLSVLLVGIDGTSKQNFARAMPKTKEYMLKNLKAIEFHKFNKIGLNTFPNVLPLLTGLHIADVKNWTYKDSFHKIDHLFLWSMFQKAGYRTSVLMDMIYITAFHYLKKGWTHPLFDYYPRSITIASEPDGTYRGNARNCMGDTPEVTLLHDYWLQLTSTFNNSRTTPYFAYSFMARLTHDDQNKASSGDYLYLQFFQELTKRNVLNNTLLVFFSDHGERFGNIRYTYNGLIEAKTPFLYFVFPPWFEKKYPQLLSNLRANTDRLMTMFDIHATLKELVNFTGTPQKYHPLDRGISLFSTIPSTRTCEVAGIPIKYCTCISISRDNITQPEVGKVLVRKLVDHIVGLSAKYRQKCALLKHKETKFILSVTSEIPLQDKNTSLYHLTMQTTPGDAVYEATLTYKADKKVASVSGDVSRLNMYRGQAECINDSTLRPFCFCLKGAGR